MLASLNWSSLLRLCAIFNCFFIHYCYRKIKIKRSTWSTKKILFMTVKFLLFDWFKKRCLFSWRIWGEYYNEFRGEPLFTYVETKSLPRNFLPQLVDSEKCYILALQTFASAYLWSTFAPSDYCTNEKSTKMIQLYQIVIVAQFAAVQNTLMDMP